MTTSKRRVLMSHIVANATEIVLKQAKLYIAYLIHASYLLEYSRLDNYEKSLKVL